MRKNTVKQIVAVIAPVASPGREMLAGLLAALVNEPNCRMKILDDPRQLTPTLIERLSRKLPTGFVLSLEPDAKALDALARHQCPAVFVNVRDTERPRQDVRYIWNDNAAIGHMAAQHLLRQEFRSFAFVGRRHEDWSEGRKLGFRAMVRKSYPYSEIDLPVPLDDAARRQLGEWLLGLPRPVAVFTACGMLAQGVLDAAKAVRCPVPAQIAVIGVDDDRRNLSTVIPDHRRMGHAAGETVLALLNHRPCPRDPINIEPRRLIIRASTKIRRPRYDLAREIRAYIHLHFADPLGIADIADFFAVSRSTLDHRFRESTGRSVREAIEEERLRAVRRLLKSGSATLREIAAQCGFSSACRLSHLFIQRFGIAPVTWRKLQS